MSFFIYTLADFVHIIKLIFICEFLLKYEKKTQSKKRSILGIIIFGICSIIMQMLNNDVVSFIAYLLLMICILCFIYRENIKKIIISGLWISSLTSLLDMISIILVEVIVVLFEQEYVPQMDIFASLISLALVCIVSSIYNKKYGGRKIEFKIASLLVLTILALLDSLVVAVMYIITAEYNGRLGWLLYVAIIGVIVGIFIQLAAVFLLTLQKNLYKEKGEITQKYLNEQKSHYEYLENREKETKKFRHDLRSHMQMLSDLIKSREYDKVDDYMEKIHIKIDNIGNIVTVNNGMVDAIVNQYYIKAMECGVNMRVGGRFPSDCDIDAYNLCIIFSNILSNAVEAAVKSEEKKIDFNCRYTKDKIVVVVKNSFKNIGQFDNGKMETQKEDINYHGFGLENIKESVEKYNGMVDIDILDNEFKLMIMLHYMETRKDEDSNS